jgi:septal ring factor EnvC (AmiA/AmiB activator)
MDLLYTLFHNMRYQFHNIHIDSCSKEDSHKHPKEQKLKLELKEQELELEELELELEEQELELEELEQELEEQEPELLE